MNFLSCSFRSKKKHPKFQLVDLFRERKKPSSFLHNELQYIDKFAEELSKTIVSYQKIQMLSWSGIPSCTDITIQASDPKYGSICSSICSLMMQNKFSIKSVNSTNNYSWTTGNHKDLMRMKKRFFIRLTWMLKELAWNITPFVRVRRYNKLSKEYFSFGIIDIQLVDMSKGCVTSQCPF